MNSFTSNFKTKSDRNKAIKLLQGARVLIEKEEEEWVCTAISCAGRDQFKYNIYAGFKPRGMRYTTRIANRLRNNIRKALDDRSFVTDWLIETQNIPAAKVYAHELAYRLLWIDSMIADLSAAG